MKGVFFLFLVLFRVRGRYGTVDAIQMCSTVLGMVHTICTTDGRGEVNQGREE